MITDIQNTFSDEQAITATAPSTNVLNLLSAVNTSNAGGMPLMVRVVEDFAALTSLEVRVEESDTSDFASADVIATTGAVPLADLKAGYEFSIANYPHTKKQYQRLRYVVVGDDATAGKIDAALYQVKTSDYRV